MSSATDESVRRRAKTPHELFMLNLFGFHLLATPVLLFSGLGLGGLIVPPLLSGIVIAYLYWRGNKAEQSEPWFVMVHWKAAVDRSRLLLLAYGASALLLAGAWLLSLGAGKSQDLMFTVLTRIAVMPTVVMVFVCAVLESGAIQQAGRGEVAERVAARYPPRAG